ncbi:hypothetical protein ABT373_00915 [Streptomyces sp. NPDC000070]|uniref:hypothetical protein n=1 Tax=Streptomyces sp. NPDC000070 TaxID=3154240 RepID=UPI003326AAE9
MRIRSALAAVALTAAITAAGAATAHAHADDDGPGHRYDYDHIPCSPYAGELGAETAGMEYRGAVCHKDIFDH